MIKVTIMVIYLNCNTRIYMIGREQRVKPIIIDPGLYQDKKTDIYWMTQRRAVPTSFRLFTGKSFHSRLLPLPVLTHQFWNGATVTE